LDNGIMRPRVHAILVAFSAIACNAISGASDLVVEDEVPIGLPEGGPSSSSTSGDPSSSSSSGGTTIDSGTTEPVDGWTARHPVNVVSDAPAEIANAVVLVTLPDDFDGGAAQASGEDIRFRLTADATSSLDHYIESWTPGAPKNVWVKVPSVQPGSSEIALFYGNATAPAASDFAKTFPRVQKTAGNGAGSLAPKADIDVDWFELAAGDTLTLDAGKALRISAARVIIAGTVDGTGKGFEPGATPNSDGLGPGGGKFVVASGAGGAGYGGAGGVGGFDSGGTGGAAGSTYGSVNGDDADLGSGGGSAGTTLGGAGGGSITVHGWRTSVPGKIVMNGVAATDTVTGQAGGGGSGGTILLAGLHLELAGGSLEARGGAGGAASNAAGDGGGGGGGGRIKLRQRSGGSLAPAATTAVTRGLGGVGVSTAPGANGTAGTTSTSATATTIKGVTATLGAEVKL
jgi:hypothetical protein